MKTLRTALIVCLAGVFFALAPGPASAATQLGGINLDRYCFASKGGTFDSSKAVLVQNNAWGWRCQDSFYVGYPYGWVATIRNLDMNTACRYQYGSGAYARLIYTHAQGWRCYR